MTKYEQNVIKAEALKVVGESIENSIRYAEEDIKDNEKNVKNYAERIENGEEGLTWYIDSYKKDIDKSKAVLDIWKIAQKAIDKELMF